MVNGLLEIYATMFISKLGEISDTDIREISDVREKPDPLNWLIGNVNKHICPKHEEK